jgi:hypothetical protein
MYLEVQIINKPGKNQLVHPTILTEGAPLEAPGLVSFLGYAVSKSTEVNQTSPLGRHHPTETLETMRFGVSNVPGGLLGSDIVQVEGRPSWPSGVPAEAASGRAAHHARTQQARHACIGSSGYKTGP